MDYQEQIDECLSNDTPLDDIVRRFFLVHPTYAFTGNLIVADDILNRVSVNFSIPINDILVCGSAKLGFSLYKGTSYNPGSSDIDLAIINNKLYCDGFNRVLSETRNYSKGHLFRDRNLEKYKYGISLGMINYNFMPEIELKKDLLKFFDEMSIDYRNLFSSVSCCFYMSEDNFKQKQINGLSKWKNNNFKDYK